VPGPAHLAADFFLRDVVNCFALLIRQPLGAAVDRASRSATVLRFLSWFDESRKDRSAEATMTNGQPSQPANASSMRKLKIARSLKRTVGATRQKAFQLGVSMDSRG
jgi:hypothetical protein